MGAGAAVLRVTTTGLGASKKSASSRWRAVRFLEGATRWASRRASNRSIWKLPPCGFELSDVRLGEAGDAVVATLSFSAGLGLSQATIVSTASSEEA